MDLEFHLRYPLSRFSRLGGPGLLTTSRNNDFELYRPARRAGLDPLTTTQEGVAHDDSSILPPPGQARGKAAPVHLNPNTPCPQLIPMTWSSAWTVPIARPICI